MVKKVSSGAYLLFSQQKRRFFRVIANSIQYNTQYTSCNSALLAQETLFLTPKALFSPKIFRDLRKNGTKLNIATT